MRTNTSLLIRVLCLLLSLGIQQVADAELGQDWKKLDPLPGVWQGRLYHASVSFQGKLWVMGGRLEGGYGRNDVLCSSDGLVWEQATAAAPWPARTAFTSVVFNNRIWIMGGGLNDVWSSADGTSWTRVAYAPWRVRSGHTSVVHDGKMWVIGGYQSTPLGQMGQISDVWYSEDGVNWTSATLSAPWPARYDHASTVYNGKIWIMGGLLYDDSSFLSDVWYSEDGVNWTSATLAAPWDRRTGSSAFVHDGKMWLAGASDKSDLWCTTNGTSWTLVSPISPWAAQVGQRVISHNGEIWVTKYDVWHSTDGTSWTRTTPTVPRWRWRMGHASLVYDNKLWVIAGDYQGRGVYYTEDGKNWVLATDSPAFGWLYEHASCVHDGKMWVLGGMDSDRTTYGSSKVWSSTDGQTWTLVSEGQFPAMYGCSAVSWRGRMYLAGGARSGAGYLVSSADGKTWTREYMLELQPGKTLAVHRNRLFLFEESPQQSPGKPDTFLCFDGKNIVEKSWGPTPSRSYAQAFSFDGRLWMLGGQRNRRPLHDVWCSVDGESWTLVTNQPPWWLRSKHSAVPFLNRIFLMGGNVSPDPELPEASEQIWVTDPPISAVWNWWEY